MKAILFISIIYLLGVSCMSKNTVDSQKQCDSKYLLLEEAFLSEDYEKSLSLADSLLNSDPPCDEKLSQKTLILKQESYNQIHRHDKKPRSVMIEDLKKLGFDDLVKKMKAR